MDKVRTYNSDVVIVGSGAGGATLAKELSGSGKKVLVVERGKRFKTIGRAKHALLYYDKFALSKSIEGIIIYRCIMPGGTTVCSCGNGVRAIENELSKLGISLKTEFEEAEKELHVSPLGEHLLGLGTRRIMEAANSLGYSMFPMPKMMDQSKCTSCGACIHGCITGSKWSSLNYLTTAIQNGAKVLDNTNIERILIQEGKVLGVEGKSNGEKVIVNAKIVILSAGGIGTPEILLNSGIEAGKKLFADIFIVTYGIHKDVGLKNEVTMGGVCEQFQKTKGFMLSPFVDNFLALLSVMYFKDYSKIFKINNFLGIICKVHDELNGGVTRDGKTSKVLTKKDFEKLENGFNISKEILVAAGVKKESVFRTKPRGAHPGGTAAIGEVVDINQETKFKNLFISDASVFPCVAGAPPIVTIVALSKRLSKMIIGSRF